MKTAEELIEISNAIDLLRKEGYFVDALWHTDDIQLTYDCSDEDATSLLDKVFTSDSLYDTIWDEIDFYANDMELVKK
jgi:hypothetical protein